MLEKKVSLVASRNTSSLPSYKYESLMLFCTSMLNVSSPIIRNIKIAIQFSTENCNISDLKHRVDNLTIPATHYHNFSVVRESFVYSVFWSCGYINITKIRSFADINAAKTTILNILQLTPSDLIRDYSLHNICASGSFSNRLDLEKLTSIWSRKEGFRVRKNLSTFPALFVKCSNLGTCVLFQSGKYSLVGVREEKNLVILLDHISRDISQQNGLFS